MQAHLEQIISETAQASNEGRVHFGQVVGALLKAGVESYTVDYRAHRTVYYMPDGATLSLEQPAREAAIAQDFSAEAIQQAIRQAQRAEIMYPEFKRLSQIGGCVGYSVWLTGRHVRYFGRNGDSHVERFPD